MTRIIKDTSHAQKRIDPDTVARLLGAEKTNLKIDTKRNPISLYGLRLFLFEVLRSTGKRPKLAQTRRARIALPAADWEKLEALAEYLSETVGVKVGPGQVATALIHVGLSELGFVQVSKRSDSKK